MTVERAGMHPSEERLGLGNRGFGREVERGSL
jgi:hypothetical protein